MQASIPHRAFTVGVTLRQHVGMDIAEIRYRNTRMLMDKLVDAAGRADAQRTGAVAMLAAKLGKSQSQVSHFAGEKPIKKIGDRIAREIEDAVGRPPGWLDQPRWTEPVAANEVRGSESAAASLRPIRTWDTAEDLPADEYVIVPRMTLRFAAGSGGPIAEADPQLSQGQAFRTAYIRRKRLKPKALMSAYAVGDSMEPRICDGDALLIDTSQVEVQDGKVYAMAWDDSAELRVKRLYKMPNGGLLIRSDNRDKYPEITVAAEDLGMVTVLGRVVLVSGDV